MLNAKWKKKYYTEVLISQYDIKAYKQLMICHKSYVYRVYSCFVNSLSWIGEWACWEKRGLFYEKLKRSFVYMNVHTEKYMQTSTAKGWLLTTVYFMYELYISVCIFIKKNLTSIPGIKP